MHAFLIVLRCNNSDIPVSLFNNLNEALGAAQQLVQDVRQNYSIVHTYARLVNAPSNTSPLCVSIYQFISNELRLVLGSYYFDRELAGTDETRIERSPPSSTTARFHGCAGSGTRQTRGE
jgi:hypothetical protein